MRRRVWHGCIMLDLASSMMLGRPPMTRASAVPLPEAVDDEVLDTNTQHSRIPSRPPSRTEFYVHTLHLYKILRKILSEVYEPWEDGRMQENIQPQSQQFQILIELDAELEAFKLNLPAHLQWHTSQESSSVPQQSSRESSLLRARFLHLRILLLRPTLVKFCREGQPDESSAHFRSRKLHAETGSKIFSDFSLGCSTSCIEAAIELSFLMNEISRTELASVWWYNIFYTFTAGAVLILAQTYPAIESIFSKQALSDSWKACIDCLETMNAPGSTAKTCASNLRKALAVAVQESVHPPRPNTKSTAEDTPETVGPGVGHAASSTYTPTLSPSHPSGDVDVAANRDFLGILESDPFGYVWGQDINDPLPEMLWDEFWLMAPSL
ncbi:hypothetical protein MW887_008047 [Aspergillus wentii]|nr:hypothetical protein MW887_008047 [Aspergillus wentii]